MSILSVANVHFETTGANRIEYLAANGFLNLVTSGNIAISSRNFTLSNNAGLAGNVFTSNGTTFISQAPSINLSSQVTNTLQAANGGTGLTSPGTSGNVLVSNGTSWVSQVPLNKYTSVSVISSNTSANAGTYYVTTAVVTLTLPGSPSVGDIVGFANPTVNTTSVIARNTANISGLAEDLTFDKANASIVFMYSGVNKGWIFV